MKVSPVKIASIILLIGLIWMDSCLYFQIQNISETSVGDDVVTIDLATSSSFMSKFSYAFKGISVKMMMTDPVDNYILSPLAEALSDFVNFKDNFSLITPNFVSYAGVVSALISAKLVSYDNPALHKLSYVMFQLRTWLDDLDGVVARSRLGIHKQVSLQKTPGYVIDGVCDAIGFVAYIIGCYVYLKNSIKRRRKRRLGNRYNLQSITEVKSSSPSTYIPLQQDVETDCCHNQHYADDEELHDENNLYSDREMNSVDDEEEEIHFDYEQKRGKNQSLLDDRKIQNPIRRLNFSRYKIYLQKMQKGKQSTVIFYRYIKEKLKNKLSDRQLVLVTLCFIFQVALCAAFWNRYILVYRDLLETQTGDHAQTKMKVKILKSNIMYIIIWFWRLTNGHSLMQMLIASVFIGKLWQFLDFIKYVGFVEIVILAFVTELHIIDVRSYLS